MSGPSIGFYVHYHGRGHKHRTEAVLRQMTLPVDVVTSRIDHLDWHGPTLRDVIEIDCDVDDVPPPGLDRAADTRAFHYAPLWASRCTRRVAQYAAWLDRVRPALVVVDVSAEITLLTRLAAVPTVVVRQHGDRTDPAHTAAYETAEFLLAPFPESMESDVTPAAIRDRTRYVPGFTRFGAGPVDVPAVPFDRPTVVVLFGRGGNGPDVARLAAAARAVPDRDWLVVGAGRPAGVTLPGNLAFAGWVADPRGLLSAADVVVTAAGHNSVMELGQTRKPMIAIAEDRPFREQHAKTEVLEREGLAVGLSEWPADSAWPALVRKAENLDATLWDRVFAGDGAAEAAKHIEKAAAASWNIGAAAATTARTA